MITPIILSQTDALAANTDLKTWLTKPVILWLVLGEGPEADIAIDMALELINSGKDTYKSSRVVHALNPNLILEKLKSLRVNPKLSTPIDWDDVEKYIILSISVNKDTIGAIVLKSKFPNQPRGYINKILRKAVAADAR